MLAVVLILVLSGGDDDDPDSASTGTQTAAGTPQILGQANLAPPEGSDDDANGVAFVVRQGGQLGLAVQAQGLAASSRESAYGVWLYNSPSNARFLGFIQTPVAADGNLQSVSALEQDTEGFRELLLTRESQENPQRPSNIVLRGEIAEPSPGAGGTATTPQGGAQTTPAPPAGGAQTTP